MSKARSSSINNPPSPRSHPSRRNGSVQPIEPRISAYDRKDPFTAFNALRKLVEALPTGHGRNGGSGGKISGEERKLALGLMSIVEPFIGLAPSRRTLTRLPNEILDAIAAHVPSKRDLLSIALVCKRLYDVVFPRHHSYRDVRCRLSALAIWHHLATHRALARNVRRLEVLDERASAGKSLVPKGIMNSDTDLESSDDERRINVHGKQEKLFLAALARMSGLVEFVWSCNHSLVPLTNVWPTLLKCYTLQRVEINDNLVFSAPKFPAVESAPYACDEAGLPNLKSVLVRSSKKGLGFCKDPNLTHITEMLSHCSALETLSIQLTTQRYLPGRSDNFFIHGRWPSLRTLSLTTLFCAPSSHSLVASFLAAHCNLEVLDLSIGTAATGLTLPIGTLPRIRELRCIKEFARDLMMCPTADGSTRPLEALRGITLSGQASDHTFLEQLKQHKVKRFELKAYTELEDLKRLIECIPHVTWLDVGKKVNATQSKASAITNNVVDWADLLKTLPELSAFHGVRFFYEAPSVSIDLSGGMAGMAVANTSASHRSRIKKNDEVASVLCWKCPKLKRVDCWESLEDDGVHTGVNAKKVIILSKDGERIRWDVKKIKV